MELDTNDDTTPVIRFIVVRVVVRLDSEATFVERYSRFVKEDRIFIVTQKPQPIGTLLRFIITLADGKPVLKGTGTVLRVREASENRAHPPGMVLRFATLDESSQVILEALKAARERRHTPPPATLTLESLRTPERPRRDDTTGTFTLGEQPRFGERWDDHSMSANPFTGVGEEELDYFVEWSVENVTHAEATGVVVAPDPVPTPVEHETTGRAPARRRLPAWATLLGGVAGGVLLGAPLGAAILWRAEPRGVMPTAEAARARLAPPRDPSAALAPEGLVAREAPPQLVALRIRCQPGDAHVAVDGVEMGRAPLTLQVRPGEHAVSVSKSHYRPRSERLRAPADVELALTRR